MTNSRKQRREEKFLDSANSGEFGAPTPLFKNEEKSLIKDGFTVKRFGLHTKYSLPSYVSWNEAFGDEIPPSVCDYITGVSDEFPKSEISNWAQRLYVIAARANYEKHK